MAEEKLMTFIKITLNRHVEIHFSSCLRFLHLSPPSKLVDVLAEKNTSAVYRSQSCMHSLMLLLLIVVNDNICHLMITY
jgi:hypothetical protein